MVLDARVAEEDMIELAGSRWKAMRCKGDPEHQLAILAAARKFDLKKLGDLLESPIPKPKTWGTDRSQYF